MPAFCTSLIPLLILFLFPAGISCAQPLVQIKGYNQLYLVNLTSGAVSSLYSSPYPEVRTVKVSPDGSLFALLEVDHSGKIPVNYLKVLDANGALRYEGRRDVREFAWHPRANRLAFITGTFSEGAISFIPTGLYVYDFRAGSETPVTTDAVQPIALNWVNNSTEDALYVESLTRDAGKRFLRYNFSLQAFEAVPFRSIGVSPDGKYYGNHDFSCRCVRIYDAATQVERSRVNLSDTGVPAGWVYNESHLFAVRETDYDKAPHRTDKGPAPGAGAFNREPAGPVIIVVDGSDGQHIQTVSGVLPDRPPYEFMFTKPDLLISIPQDSAVNGRKTPPGGRGQITITTIPDTYRR